jgi:UDP:flavonoid glycosyltransferase YjiC (YdhE family)
MMHAILIPFGTAGDVHPFLGVAEALRRRGHRVTVVSDDAFANIILRSGLEFESLSTPAESAELLHHPDLWHPTRSYPLIFEKLVAPKIKPVFEFIRKSHVRKQTIVVASNLALGARVAREKLGLPLVSLYVSPMSLPSYRHPPPLPGRDLFPGRPQVWLKYLFSVADWRVGRILGPALNALCREQGVTTPSNIMKWWHSPDLVVGLFPNWFARPEPVWPPHTQLTGFPLYDTANVTSPPLDLESFLEAGPAPVVFMPSSSMAQAADFLRESVAACDLIGCRGVLLTRFSEQLPECRSENICSFPFVPLSWLLPRCAAIVHQAGIGTIALSLSAGIPQLAVPMGMDQHANAERLMALGTSAVMQSRHYQASRVAATIRELTTNEDIRAACRRASQWFADDRPSEDACDLIEGVFRKHNGVTVV